MNRTLLAKSLAVALTAAVAAPPASAQAVAAAARAARGALPASVPVVRIPAATVVLPGLAPLTPALASPLPAPALPSPAATVRAAAAAAMPRAALPAAPSPATAAARPLQAAAAAPRPAAAALLSVGAELGRSPLRAGAALDGLFNGRRPAAEAALNAVAAGPKGARPALRVPGADPAPNAAAGREVPPGPVSKPARGPGRSQAGGVTLPGKDHAAKLKAASLRMSPPKNRSRGFLDTNLANALSVVGVVALAAGAAIAWIPAPVLTAAAATFVLGMFAAFMAGGLAEMTAEAVKASEKTKEAAVAWSVLSGMLAVVVPVIVLYL